MFHVSGWDEKRTGLYKWWTKREKREKEWKDHFVYLGANTKTKADPPSSTIQFYWWSISSQPNELTRWIYRETTQNIKSKHLTNKNKIYFKNNVMVLLIMISKTLRKQSHDRWVWSSHFTLYPPWPAQKEQRHLC